MENRPVKSKVWCVCDLRIIALCFGVQEEREEEEIVLQPIGPGMQNLEPEGSGTLRQRSLTPVFTPEQQGNTLGD